MTSVYGIGIKDSIVDFEGVRPMIDQPQGSNVVIPNEPEQQFPALRDLLKGIKIAQKMTSLYGSDHPNTVQAIEALTEIITDFVGSFTRPTCVFTNDAVVVNDRYYAATTESRSMYERLRARGTMAITFIGDVSSEQARQFTAFLNTDPSEIRNQGGPSEFLKKHSVTRIVATEAVYTSGETDSPTDEVQLNQHGLDLAVGAVIDWLIRQDEEDELPRLPISQILSDPDMAAKLIREAVTKLHASRRDKKESDLSGEVIDDLKNLTGDDPSKWDNSTPQIRKAVSKLPIAMRPKNGFLPDVDDIETMNHNKTTVDVSAVETIVSEALQNNAEVGAEGIQPNLKKLVSLLDARASGIPTTWKVELEPTAIIKSASGTYATLMAWEKSATEHGRIAHALAALIPRALEINDIDTALMIAESLIEEIGRKTEDIWQVSNARSALLSIDQQTLKQLVESALQEGSYRAKDLATSIVETLPSLALILADFLGIYKADSFNQTLRHALVDAGQSAVPVLGRILRGRIVESTEAALETLAEIGTTSAVGEIAAAMEQMDLVFTIKALCILPKARIPLTTETCLKALSHASTDIHRAALAALGKLGDENSVKQVIRIATRRGLDPDYVAEKMVAIKTLAQIGGDEAYGCLDSMARHRPFMGKSAYEPIRLAAFHAAEEIRNSEPKTA